MLAALPTPLTTFVAPLPTPLTTFVAPLPTPLITFVAPLVTLPTAPVMEPKKLVLGADRTFTAVNELLAFAFFYSVYENWVFVPETVMVAILV